MTDAGTGVLITVAVGLLVLAVWSAAIYAVMAAVRSYKAFKRARKGK